MDALTTTILSGVVVAVIGAFATAYFAVRRERRAKQAALRERRVEALAEIQSRAYSVFVDLKGLTESIVRLREEKMPEGTAKASTWLTFFDAYAGLAQQRDDIAKEMQSLRAYYEMQTSYLETTSRNLFPSFDREFEQRYMPLSRHLYGAQTRRDHQQIDKMLNTSAVDWWFQDFYETLSLGILNWKWSRSSRDKVNKEVSNMAEGIESIKNWTFQAHKAAFDKEIDRIAGNLP